MKNFLTIVFTLTSLLSSGLANAEDSKNVKLYEKVLTLNYVSQIPIIEFVDISPIGTNQYFGGITSGNNCYGCNASTITIADKNMSNNSYTVNWLKNSLAKDGIDWDKGNMDADSFDSTPSELYLAVKVNLYFYNIDGAFLYCKNIHIAYGKLSLFQYHNFWLFSNNNNKNHTFNCTNERDNKNESMVVTYKETGDTTFNIFYPSAAK